MTLSITNLHPIKKHLSFIRPATETFVQVNIHSSSWNFYSFNENVHSSIENIHSCHKNLCSSSELFCSSNEKIHVSRKNTFSFKDNIRLYNDPISKFRCENVSEIFKLRQRNISGFWNFLNFETKTFLEFLKSKWL